MNQKNKNKIKYIAATFILIIVVNISSLSFAFAAVSSSSIVSLTNASRAAAGLGALSTNGQLESAARAKANDMFANQYFAHTSPQGKTPWDFIDASGYVYVYAGENLAIGYSDNSELHNAWMNSPTHRENIMNPNYREIGVASVDGVYEGADTTIVVESFGSTKSTQPVSQIKDVQAAADNNSSGQKSVQTSVNNDALAQKTFDIINENTSFLPAEIFQGEKVSFKIGLKGDIKEVYIMVGGQKIDFKDALASQKSDQIKNLAQTVTIDKQGESKVELTVTGSNGIQEVKDLGKLQVNNKTITNDKSDNSFWMSFIQNTSDHMITYISIMAFLALALMGYFVFRQKKYGKFINLS